MGAERIQAAAELYEAGLGTEEVAQELGISRRQVGRDLDAAGVPRRRPGRPRIYPEVERPCESCGRSFKPLAADAAHGRGRFCSHRCWGDAIRVHPPAEPRPCAHCGQVFTPPGRVVAKGHGRFCSHTCRIQWVWWNERVSPSMLRNRRMKEVWKGRWGGKLGGRPRIELEAELVRAAHELEALGWGRGAIAKRLEVTEHRVRVALKQPFQPEEGVFAS